MSRNRNGANSIISRSSKIQDQELRSLLRSIGDLLLSLAKDVEDLQGEVDNLSRDVRHR